MTSIEAKIIGALLLVAAIAPAVISSEFLIHVLIMIFFYAVLASSLNLTVGFVGELSLGHAAFLGIGAYTAAILSSQYGVPPLVCLLIAGCLAALAGLVIGAITLQLEGGFFVLITLAFAETMRLIVSNWIEFTRGPLGFSNIPPPRFSLLGIVFDFTSRIQFYYLALIILALTILAVAIFAQSTFRIGAVAVRENRRLAKAVGIDPFAQALITFVVGAFFAGIAGSFYANYISFVGPEVFGFGFTVTMLMVILGGRGTVLGPLLGAVAVGASLEYLRFINEVRLSVFGLLLIFSSIFLPNGIAGLLRPPRRRAVASTASNLG